MKTIDDLFLYIESFTNLEKTGIFSGQHYRLDRMYTLLTLFHDPHLSYKTIHVAGTKGKGSTAAFIASVLTEQGFKTGLYTSPHVSSYLERITVDRKFPHPEALLLCGKTIQKTLDNFDEFSPTVFEILTLLAFYYFQEAGCDYVVAEVGIGGRLDATNVISPVASVITPIGLEHTDVLGDTLEKIAYEKAGIIKEKVPVFSASQEDTVKEVFTMVSRQKDTEVSFVDDKVESLSVYSTREGTRCNVKIKGLMRTIYSLAMPGDFQAENACLAIITLSSLFPDISLDIMKIGIKNTKLPGRFEIIQKSPPIILDGAHTPIAIKRILAFFKELFPGEGVLLFGSVKGKDHQKMADILAPEFSHIIISTPGIFKGSNPEAVYESFKAIQPNTFLEKSPKAAFDKALVMADKELPVLVTGSFYMIAEIREFFL
ncbi:MAG: bifunctional folylpolyglutamate synthase/dihydrofolate synthase [Spirochaetales bacterium]|nr:bifunctional folylpolyglutamate synthase/dihydrofolate synthase [Spirochaetales bacterium]